MPRNILVVDDEPLNLDLLEQELADLGYAIDTADGGKAALEELRRDPGVAPFILAATTVYPDGSRITARGSVNVLPPPHAAATARTPFDPMAEPAGWRNQPGR